MYENTKHKFCHCQTDNFFLPLYLFSLSVVRILLQMGKWVCTFIFMRHKFQTSSRRLNPTLPFFFWFDFILSLFVRRAPSFRLLRNARSFSSRSPQCLCLCEPLRLAAKQKRLGDAMESRTAFAFSAARCDDNKQRWCVWNRQPKIGALKPSTHLVSRDTQLKTESIICIELQRTWRDKQHE